MTESKFNLKSEGIVFILSSPSGGGKTTIARKLIEQDSNTYLSRSYTTRPMRDGEINGKDYDFINHNKFIDMVAENKFVEYAIIYDHLYGTPKDEVELQLSNGKDVVFDIDWQGAETLRKKMHNHVVSIFILPPSLDILKQRLEARSPNIKNLDQRLKSAINEIAHYKEYDYVIINDDLNHAMYKIKSILDAERCNIKRNKKAIMNFIENM